MRHRWPAWGLPPSDPADGADYPLSAVANVLYGEIAPLVRAKARDRFRVKQYLDQFPDDPHERGNALNPW
jgi:hypothetical protein